MPTSPDAGRSALPDPEDLKKYDAAYPGLGRRIIEMVQEEQKHLHYIERAEVSLSRRGQLFGFVIAISFLVVAAVLVGLGHAVAGTIIGSVDLVALTTVFVVGRRSKDSNLGPRQVDSTDRLIRELRRKQSKSVRAKKSSKKEQSASLEIKQAADNSDSEPPTETSVQETQDTTAPAEDSNSGDLEDCGPELIVNVDPSVTEENLPHA